MDNKLLKKLIMEELKGLLKEEVGGSTANHPCVKGDPIRPGYRSVNDDTSSLQPAEAQLSKARCFRAAINLTEQAKKTTPSGGGADRGAFVPTPQGEKLLNMAKQAIETYFQLQK